MTKAASRPHLPSRAVGESTLLAALAGISAGAIAIGLAELLAGLVPGVPSLVVSVGALVIALQPAGAKDFVTTLFGTNDKLALNVAVVVVALLIAAGAGVAARQRFTRAVTVFLLVGALAVVGAMSEPLVSTWLAALNAVIAVAVGLGVLWYLLRLAGFGPTTGAAPASGPPAGAAPSATLQPMPDWARRRFLLQAGGFMATAAVAGFVGRSLLNRSTATQQATITSLPPAGQTVEPLTASESIQAPGISPIVTPNNAFYRIDTELIVPQVSASGWHLEVTGMVDHPLRFSYADLLKLPLFEQYVTLACVSNPVGGPLVGNALWTGVRLKQLLEMAGVKSGASQIVGRAADGFTVGFPTSWALASSREPMVVVGMNRKLLPAKHGYPARLIVPGLYGYVSATKWLTQIELTTMEAFNAYWVKLGWAKLGPMVTQSRIDHPQAGTHVKAGTVEVDGVAWAGDRGIKAVQIQVDNEPWQDAELSRAISDATWVQWLVRWPAKPGGHSIQVRAIDGTGAVQVAKTTGPGPGGATGLDMVDVFVG